MSNDLPDFDDPTTLAAHIIELHEGYRQFPYLDTRGNETIGFGTCLKKRGLTQLEAAILVARDVADIERALQRFAWWQALAPARQAVLIDMAYDCGVHGLLYFTEMLDAIARGDFEAASQAMLNSKWALEVSARARDDAHMMLLGVYGDADKSR